MKKWILYFITFLIGSTCSGQNLSQKKFQLVEATIDSIHEAIQNHQLTSVDLIEMYLERIKQANLDLSRGAPINAFVNINPSIFEEAKRLDDYYKRTGKLVGPLHSIPIIIKDNIDTYDTPSTSGSLALLGSQPIQDAFIVKKLREAGALILGKSAMDEFANGMFGISNRSGRIGNPYDPLLNPGGSSGGSAAAVNANFAMVGIGTDNSGSVRIPAAFNGIYGLRPSTGLLSQSGIFPRGNLDGVAGPLARTVKDLAIVLSILAQPDSHDPQTLHIPRTKSYTDFLDLDGLKGKKIGVIRQVAQIDPFRGSPSHIQKIYENLFQKFAQLGVTLIDVDLPHFNVDRKNHMAGEIEDINEYLASFPSTRENFQDICHSNRTQSFGGINGCLEHIKKSAPKYSQTYNNTVQLFLENSEYLSHLMQQNQLDAFLMPISTQGSPTYDALTVNTWMLPVSSNSGLPSIVLIAGYTEEKLPVGVELIGKLFGEPQLIAMAYAFEQKSSPRIIPTIRPDPQHLLKNFTIPQLNNLFTMIGYKTYQKILKYEEPEDLTPNKFNPIVREEIARFSTF